MLHLELERGITTVFFFLSLLTHMVFFGPLETACLHNPENRVENPQNLGSDNGARGALEKGVSFESPSYASLKSNCILVQDKGCDAGSYRCM